MNKNIYGDRFYCCVACGSKSIKLWRKKSYSYRKKEEDIEFEIYRCSQCGTGFLNPPPHNGLLSRIYECSGHALTSPVTLKEILKTEKRSPNSTVDSERISRHARRMDESGNSRALDIGSGYGFFTKALRSEGYESVSINPGRYENEVFKKMNGSMPLPIMFEDYHDDRKFGVILMSQVLEHIVNPRGAVSRVAELLTDGGVFACAVPNFSAFTVKILGTRDNACLWVPEHVNYFTANGLSQLLNRCGLEVEYTEQITRFRYDALERRFPILRRVSHVVDMSVKYGQLPVSRLFNAFGNGIYLNVYARKP